jgi:DNA-binding HxlR family transcriptional regulator
MRHRSLQHANCSIARTVSILGERWTLVILRQAFLGARRFEDYQRGLGIARNMLADRLRTLVDEGILERRPYSEHPPRHEYRLTAKGRDLYPILVTLMRWGDRHVGHGDGAPMVLVHAPCGHDAAPVLTCSACGEALDPRDVRPEPGPGAHPRAPAASI